MKSPIIRAAFVAALLPSGLQAQSVPTAKIESLKQEIELAYQRGLNHLKSQQNPQTGQWGDAEPVAFTGLAVSAIMLDPTRKPSHPAPAEAQKGYDFIRGNAKPDGGIYVEARANYNTSIALMALLLSPTQENQDAALKARRFVVGQQNDFGEKGKMDNAFDGGVGYGSAKPDKPAHADMSNTTFALEALYYAQSLLADKGDEAKNEPQLNYGAAIDFIKRCQNLPGSNNEPWVSPDPKDRGGFVYSPGETRGTEFKTADGRTALRSYGSMSYAGLLSFIYAGLSPDDPSVEAVMKWLSENYTLDENPGMGAEGKYYYYHTMAKALALTKTPMLKLQDGSTVDWRADLARKLLNLQQGDGSWKNDAGRWMESNDTLVTAYSLLALSRIHQSL